MEMRNNMKTRRGRTKEQWYWLTRWVIGITKKSTEGENKLAWENWKWMIPRRQGTFLCMKRRKWKIRDHIKRLISNFNMQLFSRPERYSWTLFPSVALRQRKILTSVKNETIYIHTTLYKVIPWILGAWLNI